MNSRGCNRNVTAVSPTRASYKCPRKSVPQECSTRASHKTVSDKNGLQEFWTRMSRAGCLPLECPSKVPHKSECPKKVLLSYKRVPQECLPQECVLVSTRAGCPTICPPQATRASHSLKSVPRECVLQAPYRSATKSVLQERPARVRAPKRYFHKNVPQECLLQECPCPPKELSARVSHRSVPYKRFPQECLLQHLSTRVSHKSVPTRVFFTRVSPSVSYNSFSTRQRVSDKGLLQVLQECPTRVSPKRPRRVCQNMPEQCLVQELSARASPTRVPYKILQECLRFAQKCPTRVSPTRAVHKSVSLRRRFTRRLQRDRSHRSAKAHQQDSGGRQEHRLACKGRPRADRAHQKVGDLGGTSHWTGLRLHQSSACQSQESNCLVSLPMG